MNHDITQLFDRGDLLTIQQLKSFGYETAMALGFVIVRHPDGFNYGYVIDNVEERLYRPLIKYRQK